jgi:hypothetical protein
VKAEIADGVTFDIVFKKEEVLNKLKKGKFNLESLIKAFAFF